MKQKYPQIFEDEKYGVQAQKLFDDANEMLKKIIENDWIELKSVIEFGLHAQMEMIFY